MDHKDVKQTVAGERMTSRVAGSEASKTVVAGTQTLMRALDILDCLASGKPELTSIEIAREVRLTPPTVHRLLKALVSRKMIVHEGERYSLGPYVMLLAGAMMRRADQLVQVCSPALERVRERTGETAALYCIVGQDRMCVAEFVSLQPIRMESGVGHVYPLLVGAAGKLLLAWRPELLTHPGLTGSPEKRWVVEAQLPGIRAAGFAVSFGEVVTGAASLAVPLFDTRGDIVAAIGVAGPAERWNRAAMERAVPEIIKESEQLTQQLGLRLTTPSSA
jgi:DNA-binding IclR family transcriptional regulator